MNPFDSTLEQANQLHSMGLQPLTLNGMKKFPIELVTLLSNLGVLTRYDSFHFIGVKLLIFR